MKELNPNKIKMARQLRCLTMDRLVARMGAHSVSKMAISKIERGLINPSQHILLAIANACMVPVDFFYNDDVRIGNLEFRFKNGTPDRKRKEIEAQVIAAVQEYMELNSNNPDRITFKNPLKGTTVSNYTEIEQAAELLRKKWNIGLQPIFSVYELLQDYGIGIIEIEIDCADVIGLSTFVNRTEPVIIINSKANLTTERKRFTALHELAHLLLQFKQLSDSQFATYLQSMPQLPYNVTLKLPDTERLCECFASAMLLPGPCVHRRIGQTRSSVHLDELISVRQTYGISIAATVHRLHTLRVIEDTLYHRYFEDIISKNELEIGWGSFPIQETANTVSLLQLRFCKSLEK